MPCVEPFANLPLCLSRDINAIYCSGQDQFCQKWRQTQGQTGKGSNFVLKSDESPMFNSQGTSLTEYSTFKL